MYMYIFVGSGEKGEEEETEEAGESETTKGFSSYTTIYFRYLHIPSYTFIYPQMPLHTPIYLHIPQTLQYQKNKSQHETQKWPYLGPQGVSKAENLTQRFVICLQRLWHTQRAPKIIKIGSLKRFGGASGDTSPINRDPEMDPSVAAPNEEQRMWD